MTTVSILSFIRVKVSRLSTVEAASVPMGALTAWPRLFDRARLQAGEHVLGHGGAGAVGMFALPLARFHGVPVVSTASARTLAFVEDVSEVLVCYALVVYAT